jgi:hypothetical protein
MSELQHYHVKVSEILRREAPWGYSERFDALMRAQAERAHHTYDAALALLPEVDRDAQKPGLMMASIYRTLLREIERGFRVLQRIVHALRKLDCRAPIGAADDSSAAARGRLAAGGLVWPGGRSAILGAEVTLYETAGAGGAHDVPASPTTFAYDNGQHILIAPIVKRYACSLVGVDPERVLHRTPLHLVDAHGQLRLPPGRPHLFSWGPGDGPSPALRDRIGFALVAASWAMRRFRVRRTDGRAISRVHSPFTKSSIHCALRH